MSYRPTPLDFIILLAISSLWGSSFMFIEIALKSFGPLSLAATRIVLAGAFLYIIARVKGEVFPTDKPTLKALAIMGLAGTAPFVLISWAQQTIDSSTAAIVMSFAPLTTLVMAHFLTHDEKLSIRKIIGLITGIIGVFILFGGVSVEDIPTQGLALSAVFIGTVCYAFASVQVKKLHHVSALVTAASFLGMASFVIFPATVIFDPPWQHEITLEAAIAIIFLGVFASGFASLLLINLIKRAGVTFSSFTNYIVPFIAVLWGVFLLGEHLHPNTWIALLLILSGVAVTTLTVPKRFTAGRTRARK